jgi:hypothetical protein
MHGPTYPTCIFLATLIPVSLQYSGEALAMHKELAAATVRDRPGKLSALGVFPSKSVLYGAFVWACRVLNSQKRRFWARAGGGEQDAGGILPGVPGAGARGGAPAALLPAAVLQPGALHQEAG